MDRITIIGLGLIGGSIGLGLKKAKLEIQLVGHDAVPAASSDASRMKAVDKTEWNIHKAVQGAAMVIIATPVLAMREIFELIADDLIPGAIVTDTGSSKAEVMAWAEELLPENVSFIGGHPMAGKELNSIRNAEAELFQGAVYCIVPSPRAGSGAIDSVSGMARHLGAEPFFVDASEHDGFAGAVSHLPMVMAAALTTMVFSSPAKRELGKVAAGGFYDASRLASGSSIMTHDIMVSNRVNVLRWIDRYVEELTTYRDLLAADDPKPLDEMLIRAQNERDRWLKVKSGEINDDVEGPPAASSREIIQDMFLGRTFAHPFRRGDKLRVEDSDKK